MTPQEINSKKQRLLDALNVAKTSAEITFLKENCNTVDVETYEMFGQAERYIKPINCPRGLNKCNDCPYHISTKSSIRKTFCIKDN